MTYPPISHGEAKRQVERMGSIYTFLTTHSKVQFTYMRINSVWPFRPENPIAWSWFLADKRWYENDDVPWVCVHNRTTSPMNLLRNLDTQARYYRHEEPWREVFIFECASAAEAKSWLVNHGYNIKNQAGRTIRPYSIEMDEPVMNMPIPLDSEVLRLERQIDEAQRRLSYIQSLPAEPVFPKGTPKVIWFKRRFTPGGKRYTYAAVKTADGWYTTGPRTPKAFTWKQLIQWVREDDTAVVKIAPEGSWVTM